MAAYIKGAVASGSLGDESAAEAVALLQRLVRVGQGDLLAAWKQHPGASKDASAEDAKAFFAGVARFCAQALALDDRYPGGLAAYVANAERLLTASARGDNAFAGLEPSVPQVVSAYPGASLPEVILRTVVVPCGGERRREWGLGGGRGGGGGREDGLARGWPGCSYLSSLLTPPPHPNPTQPSRQSQL